MLKKVFIIIIALLLTNCSYFLPSKNKELTFVMYDDFFVKYNVLTFKDNNDSLIYVISEKIKKNEIDKSLDTMIECKQYNLELQEVNERLYIKCLIRGHLCNYVAINGQFITYNDTLVTKAYMSPNIIGIYYKK